MTTKNETNESPGAGSDVPNQSSDTAAVLSDANGGGVFDATAFGLSMLQVIREAGFVYTGPLRLPGLSEPRIAGPGLTETTPPEPIFLRSLLADHYQRNSAKKADSSWSGYRTLVRKWEQSHSGGGPDVRQIDEITLQSFFESREEWHSRRSWQRNRDLFFALLKTGCKRTLKNKAGRENEVLNVESLPVWDVPPARWFRDRTPPQTERGGHRKRKLELLTVSEFERVMQACELAQWKLPCWWRAWLGLLWFCGPRFADSFRYQWNTGRLHINRRRELIDFTETKCGGNSGVPLPSSLRALLDPLWSEDRNGEPIFTGPVDTPTTAKASYLSNRERYFNPEYSAIWSAANVEKRHPHELRSVCISHWLKHAPKYRFAVTGHSAGNDIQLTNYVILDADFRRACETFPMPKMMAS